MVSRLVKNVSSRLIRHQTDQSPLYQPRQGTLQTHSVCKVQSLRYSTTDTILRVYSPGHCTRTETRTRVSGVKSRRDNHLHIYGLLVFKVHHDSVFELSQLFYRYIMVAQWHKLALASNGTPPINVTNITV